jgi:hypothetical protein
VLQTGWPEHGTSNLTPDGPRRKRNEDGGVPPTDPKVGGCFSKRSDSRVRHEPGRLKDLP